MLLATACAMLALAATFNAPTSSPASAPASNPVDSRPSGLRPFQPGVSIDWREPSVRVAARVVLREGPLEFFACFPGKEHESILRMEAKAQHIAMALGLIGVEPAPLPAADAAAPRAFPPAASLVDITITKKLPGAAGASEVDAWSWLLELSSARPPIARPWVFLGSRADGQGGLVADRSGAGLALVDIAESLVGLTRSHTSSDAGLWAACSTAEIPPDDAEVELILRPARPRIRRYELDWRGAVQVDRRLTTVEEFADLIRTDRALKPDHVAILFTDPRTLQADRRALLAALERLSLPPSAIDFRLAAD